MKQILFSFALTCALSVGPAFCSTQWPNEPAGATVLLDWEFNSILGPGMSGGTSNGGISTDLSAPLSPSNVFRSTGNYQTGRGGSQLVWDSPNTTQDEIYVGLWWRSNPEFNGNSVGNNKMFFVRNLDAGTNGIFYWKKPHGSSESHMLWSTQWSWNLDQCGGSDVDVCYPNVNDPGFVPGTWYRIEVYFKASTCNDCHNGVVRWWINGILAGNYVNFAYGPNLKEWVWSETWDGFTAGFGFNSDPSHYIDHLHISSPNCGSGGCPPPAYLVITSSLLPARTGTPYTATLAADGGTKPYTWFLQSGSLPAGLTLNKGVISGTPTCVGRSDFTIRVTDASQPALTATKSYSIITSGTSTACPVISITTSEASMGQAQFTAKAIGGNVTFNLPVTGSAQTRLSIYDLTGKEMYEHSSMGQKEISIAKALKNGIYIAKFVQGAQASVLRFQVMN